MAWLQTIPRTNDHVAHYTCLSTDTKETTGIFVGDIAYETDGNGDKYEYRGSTAEWVNTDSGGAGFVVDYDKSFPVNTETRSLYSLTTAAATDAVIGGAATPTLADGSDLAVWSGFSNTPKRIIANSFGPDVAASLLGWVYVVNAASATAAATAINNALASGGSGISSVSAGTVVSANTDRDVFFIPLRGEYYNKFDAEITNIYIAPFAIDATPAAMRAFCNVEFKP